MTERNDINLERASVDELTHRLAQLRLRIREFRRANNDEGVARLRKRVREIIAELSRRRDTRLRRDMRDVERGEFLTSDEYEDSQEVRL
jgi:hypothetical protein